MAAWLEGTYWNPELPLLEGMERADDAEVVAYLLDRLLGVPVGAEVQQEIESALGAIRSSAGNESTPLADPASSEVLRQLVHVILSLPEAQLL